MLKEPVKYLRNDDHSAMPSWALLWEDETQKKTNNEQILPLCTLKIKKNLPFHESETGKNWGKKQFFNLMSLTD